jgi:AcrR family transcriptional regulator
MGTHIENKKQTHTKIIDAFWELYKEKPIEKITVKEVVAISKNSRNTFYAHFSDVYEILESLQAIVLERAENHLRETYSLLTLSSGELVSKHINTFEDIGDYLCIFLSKNDDHNFYRAYIDLNKRYLYKYLVDNKQSITYKEEIEIHYMLSGMISVTVFWYESHFCSKDELLEKLLHLSSNLSLFQK